MLFNPSLGMSSSIRELACSVSDSGKLLRIKTMRFSPSSQTVGFLPVARRGQSAAAAPPLLVLEEAVGRLAGADVDLAAAGGGGGDGDDGVEEGRGGGGSPGLLLDDGDDPVGGADRGVISVQQDRGDQTGLLSPGAVTS